MVEADRLPLSILDTYKVFEHIDIIDMLSIGIQQQTSYFVIPILVGSDFGVLGHLWSQNDVKKLWSGVFAPPANALGLSIEEKDLLFCTGIGRWPLPLPSYLCNPAETLADPYKGKTPLPRVPNYQEPFASLHPNTWNVRTNQYLEQSPETHNHRMH